MQEVVELFSSACTLPKAAKETLCKNECSEEIELAISLIQFAKESLRNQIITYFSTLYVERLKDASIRSSSEVSYLNKKQLIERLYSDKMEQIERVFNKFQVISPSIIIYGSEEYANYHVCKLGVSDRYKNAFWIHENLIKELIHDIPKEFPIHNDAQNYFRLLEGLKTLAEIC